MHAPEVVEHEVKRYSVFQVLDLLAESFVVLLFRRKASYVLAAAGHSLRRVRISRSPPQCLHNPCFTAQAMQSTSVAVLPYISSLPQLIHFREVIAAPPILPA